MRYSLIGIIVFTSGVILSKLLFGQMSDSGFAHRLVFGLSSLFNSFALLIFVLSFAQLIAKGTALWCPIRALIWGCGVTSVLGVISIGYFADYLLTGEEVAPLLFLQPLSVLAFLFTYGATIWFLVKFRLIEDYREFVRR
jgi:hypothetical protein